MSMDIVIYDSTGVPWLDGPLMLHSSRESSCKLTPKQCAFETGFWRFWYEADHRFGLPTIAFLMTPIILFTLAAALTLFAPASLKRSSLYRRTQAGLRYLSYKSWKIDFLRWFSPSLGVLLLGAAGVVFFLAMTLGPQPYYWPNTQTLSFGNSPPLATRAGWMSIACLPFIFILGAKENPITLLTRISHDQLMVFHRWVSWVMFALALVHTFPFIIYHLWKGDMYTQWKTSVFYWTGVIAIIAQAWLTFMSMPFIRNRFYEFFKAVHYLMSALFFVFVFLHCNFRLTSWNYLIAAAVVYSACLAASQLRTYCEHGWNHHAALEMLPSGVLKVTVPTSSTWAPGQHVFIRFLCSGLHSFSAHPFTICSLPVQEQNSQDWNTADMVFYITPRGGFTSRLAALARQNPGRKVRVLLDGPYGGLKDQTLARFDKAVIIAGGAGAGFTLPVIKDVLRRQFQSEERIKDGRAEGIRTTEIKVVLAVRDGVQQEWYANAINDLLDNCGCALTNISVDIHVTGEDWVPCPSCTGQNTLAGNNADIESAGSVSDSESEKKEKGTQGTWMVNSNPNVITLNRGRPCLPALMEDATSATSSGKSVGLTVCGPSGMLFDVRNAAADAQRRVLAGKGGPQEVYLYSEHFAW